ncbi:DNA polymerase epsilon catalytic subunit A [Trichomonascus vanleenenianus]|uniref:DNA polymerase epsilon catalytic subunit n=1 Tax=Trichomonascus vanleenenianus TaxID=2268995 RepID=UPI003EC97000
MMGFPRYDSGPAKVGWLINMHSTITKSDDIQGGLAAVDYYFLDEEGGCFKSTLQYYPYFLLSIKNGHDSEVEEFLRRKLEGFHKNTERLVKDDLSLPNHLLGIKRNLIKVNFNNVSDLLTARKELRPIIDRNKRKQETAESYEEVSLSTLARDVDWNETADLTTSKSNKDASEFIQEIHEYDVPYHVRVSIDKDIRVGKWYTVDASSGALSIREMPELVSRPDPVVLAYDIETTKDPLKFPDSSKDKIMMISYMIDGIGYLITNREVVSEDIDDFEYTPKPEFPGVFTIFNEKDEKDLIIRFFEHIREERPTVIATFNGDFFDWPFVDERAKFHGLDMYQEIGFQKDSEDEYKSAYCVHMDCFRWVKRDSYLPQGSQGLKAVTTAKLGYSPLEIDPELMTSYAIDKPQVMAEYSVSDAVATYYLYMKYVHPFIFSLCNIIPLNPDEVLRKGTGTLCEMLLMVQANEKSILLPNKHTDPLERFYNGHLLESETYVGGHVESLEAGVFRSDIPAKFNVDTTAIDELVEQLDRALKFSIEVEGQKKLEDVTNYDEVKSEIMAALNDLKKTPGRQEVPLIYHVDVASMYPNIMTTNRLQPDSMITEETCASCDFNRPGKTCDRRLPWSWRGEYLPAKKEEYLMIKNSLRNEKFPDKSGKGKGDKAFDELPYSEQASLIKKRLTEYCRRVYHKVKETKTIEREAIICQRENPFYVNTVRAFRDRRYEFKGLCKVWKKKVDEVPASDVAGKEEAKKMIVLYDSLQLAHKVILNSFYGYVMRKGSRWYSMEMAGVTCLTGATIIQLARSLVERLGRPLELDTDGIWCILPKTFPEDYMFKLKDGKKLPISYPCVMLNHLVHEKFTNHQYQTLVDPKRFKYDTHSDNSIFFEVDGPYKAMVLPTSKDEDKGLKKRYAVFNEDGTLAELKGFEIKRRGELQLIKTFQSQVFKEFLAGTTLEECYDAVARVANTWLDFLDTKGGNLSDEDILEMISENRSMSKSLKEYDGQKSTSICTARRLAEFLGAGMVKDKGLACKFFISRKPENAPVTERAVPVTIFSSSTNDKRYFLRRWLKDSFLDDFSPRAIIDWEYYKERLGATIQKIITVPAAYQHVKNPVPRLPHPEWLEKRIALEMDKRRQMKVTSFFQAGPPPPPLEHGNGSTESDDSSGPSSPSSPVGMGDIEDITADGKLDPNIKRKVARVTVNKRKLGSTANAKEGPQEPIPSLPAEMPDPQEDYKAWLKYQKIKWEIQRQARERRRHLFGESIRSRNNAGLAGMLRDQTEAAYANTWQLLQLSPSETPGQVRAFALINERIQVLRIQVPRTIFVNFKSDQLPDGAIPNCKVEKVSHVLPNGHSSSNLFKIEMSEETYQDELSRVDSVLKDRSVEGIYETHIDPHQRALLTLGNNCYLDNSKPGLLGKGLEKGFELSWLKPQTPDKYLSASLDYLHVLQLVSGDIQVFAILPAWKANESDGAPTAYILVLRPNAQAQKLPNLNQNYRLELAASLKKHPALRKSVYYPEELNFEDFYFDSLRGLYKKLNTILSKIHGAKGTRCMLALQSTHPDRLKKLVRNINEFPLFTLPPVSIDMPSLNWQRECSVRINKQFFALAKWISHVRGLADYGNVPIGNISGDDYSFLTDVIYARKLKENNIVLWWSPMPIPDNGGSEKDDVLKAVDDLNLPVVNNPGMYTKVCIDIDIRNLAVNTILTASIINAAEGTDLMGSTVEGSGDSIPFVENSFNTPALSVLSSVVKGWWDQAARSNSYADNMVQTFIKWVSSPSSFLYDRSLYYHVQNLSKKAFVQLIREFRRMGCRIVSADQNRVVLLTSKAVIENSYAYSSYIMRTIRAKPLFNYLDIDIREYWDILLWMDNVNYCGRGCKEITESKTQMSLYLNWHVKKFLPEILQVELEDWVVEYLEKLAQAREKALVDDSVDDEESRLTQISSTALQRSIEGHNNVGSNEENASADPNHFANGVLKEIEKPLVKRTKHLLKQYNEAVANPDLSAVFDFPKVAGMYRDLGNPVVQFIKTIAAIFNLSRDLVVEARLLRRHLLDLVDIREFSEEAAFKNPSASLIVTQVICNSCHYVRDFDLCRNDHLTRKEDRTYSFLCENCGKPYDRVILEERLVQDIERMVTLYQVQDLKCIKCKRIRESDLAEHCECSGEWVETISPNSVENSLKIYKNVALFYDFKLVQNLVETLI